MRVALAAEVTALQQVAQSVAGLALVDRSALAVAGLDRRDRRSPRSYPPASAACSATSARAKAPVAGDEPVAHRDSPETSRVERSGAKPSPNLRSSVRLGAFLIFFCSRTLTSPSTRLLGLVQPLHQMPHRVLGDAVDVPTEVDVRRRRRCVPRVPAEPDDVTGLNRGAARVNLGVRCGEVGQVPVRARARVDT